ncbi:Asp23/Gls24 family envelope stress response protein [Gordonia shandongensis]|uniref:Asp23/Gls24 family envelope stress response protein n=1 Tax=Gordonia shandongensis TaxID=376351 RepID=UPI0004264D81|nr:Asp23/Gls24 family envelope stress response protein [Gordonia shandongensis]
MTAESASAADEPLAKRIARAVLAVPGVVDLDGGLFGEVATYLPGERVSGVQLSDDEGSVHIVVDLRHDLREVAAAAAAAAEQIADRPFSVTVEDVTSPALEASEASETGTTGSAGSASAESTADTARQFEGGSDE